MDLDFLKEAATGKKGCRTVNSAMQIANIAVHMLIFVLALFLCNFLHLLLRPLSQPRIISESLVGFFLSNLPPVWKNIHDDTKRTVSYLTDFGLICHMFVVGLEMDRKIMLKLPIREVKVACTGFLTTFILSIFVTPLLYISIENSFKFDIVLSIILSGTASPLLTRLITDLKISKSDIGRFVICAAVISDLACSLLISIGYILFDPYNMFKMREAQRILKMSAALVFQSALAAKVTPYLMRWVNRENPQGKPMKGSYLVVSVAYVVIVSGISPYWEFNKPLSALLAGIFMPREGRIAKMIISKVKYFFGLLFFPAFFFWVGLELQFSKFGGNDKWTWIRLFFIFLLTVGGRIIGSVVSGVMLGFHWQETVAIGLLLSIKGHFHIYMAIASTKIQLVSMSTTIVMVIVIYLTFVHTPLVVKNIIERARKRSPTQRMALQWLHPSDELRLILCLHGPRNIQASINFMEISRGPPDPGMMVYLTDIIELTDKIAATLARGEGVDAMTVTDKGVIEMREKISNAINGYIEDDDCEGINVRRMLALSPLSNMPQDLCSLAEDLLVSLIILPFHKDQEADGTLSLGHSGFRNLNKKILRNAPCSVGILVDRGLGSTQISRTSVSLTAAIIFIGGKDDREALAYSGRVARHPGVKLTVIRFLLDASGDSVTSKISRARANSAEYEEELKLDDEYFADFYDRHVAGGHVAYVEKYLMNSGQTFSTLRSLEGQYALFIVGRGSRVNSVLTVGMNDWEECPELGPIGDILSASDFSVTASVLVIQQHSLRGELHGLQDEFSIM